MNNTELNIDKVQNVKFHLFKKIAYLILILFVVNKLLKWVFRNDNSGSIIGDSSDLNILLIDVGILIAYVFFLSIQAVLLNDKRLTKLRDVNICISILIAFPILIIASLFL